MDHRRYRALMPARKHRLRRCTRASARVALRIRGYLFRLCSADQSIDEQACRLRTCLLLHACTLPICDDLLRDPFAMPVWTDSWRARFLLCARSYESRVCADRHRYAAFTRLNKQHVLGRDEGARDSSWNLSKDVPISRMFFRLLSLSLSLSLSRPPFEFFLGEKKKKSMTHKINIDAIR